MHAPGSLRAAVRGGAIERALSCSAFMSPLASAVRLAAFAAAAFLTLGAAVASAEDAATAVEPRIEAASGRGVVGRAPLAPDDLDFVTAAAEAGLLQVRAGESAVGRSSKSDVRALAEESVLGYTLANERLRAIAFAHGVPWPEQLDAPHHSELAALEGLDGSAFDAHYVRVDGIVAHEQAVRLFERGAVSGDADVRHYAEATLPLLRSQLRHARRIADDGLARRISLR